VELELYDIDKRTNLLQHGNKAHLANYTQVGSIIFSNVMEECLTVPKKANNANDMINYLKYTSL
jgi:hypothetical protein